MCIRDRFPPENIRYDASPNFTFMFKGPVQVRDVSFHYTLFR